MSINPLTQLTIVLYEYLYNTGNKLEYEYRQRLEEYYRGLSRIRPDLYVDNNDLLNLIVSKSRFDEFCAIQSDIYRLLKTYGDRELAGKKNEEV